MQEASGNQIIEIELLLNTRIFKLKSMEFFIQGMSFDYDIHELYIYSLSNFLDFTSILMRLAEI